MRPHPRIALLALATVAALALAVAAILDRSSGRSAAPSASAGASANATSGFDGASLPTPAPAREFTLTDQSGQVVSLARYRGQVTLLAFLYTTCGAACVVIAQQIRGALDQLAQRVPERF